MQAQKPRYITMYYPWHTFNCNATEAPAAAAATHDSGPSPQRTRFWLNLRGNIIDVIIPDLHLFAPRYNWQPSSLSVVLSVF